MIEPEMTGIPDIGSAEADLDSATDRYANRFRGPAGAWLLSRQTDALRRHISPWSQASVLDVGGGHGQVAAPLLEDGHEVEVLASSEAALGRVRQLKGIRTRIGPLGELPYPDGSFDVVTSFRILAHIGTWQDFLSELCRVARYAVIVDFPIPGGGNALGPLLFGLKKRLEGDTRKFQTMKKAAVSTCLSENGLHYRSVIGQFVLPMVVHRTLNRPGLSASMEETLKLIGLANFMGTPVVMRASRMPVE